jgi:hypothetical protein
MPTIICAHEGCGKPATIADASRGRPYKLRWCHRHVVWADASKPKEKP